MNALDSAVQRRNELQLAAIAAGNLLRKAQDDPAYSAALESRRLLKNPAPLTLAIIARVESLMLACDAAWKAVDAAESAIPAPASRIACQFDSSLDESAVTHDPRESGWIESPLAAIPADNFPVKTAAEQKAFRIASNW